MITLDQAACNGCAVCAKICPHAVFEMRDKKAVMVAEERCIECGGCQLNCHEGAIQVTKGTGCLYAILVEDTGDLWGDAAWAAGTLWADGALWSDGTLAADGYLWAEALTETMTVNVWVEQQ